MENRIVTIFERAMTTIVNDIEHIESQSYYGVSIIRVYFQPNVKIEMAIAQFPPCQPCDARHAARHFPAEDAQV